MSWKAVYSVYINVATSRTYSGGSGDRIFAPLLSVTRAFSSSPPVSLIDPRRPCIIPRGRYAEPIATGARKAPAESFPLRNDRQVRRAALATARFADTAVNVKRYEHYFRKTRRFPPHFRRKRRYQPRTNQTRTKSGRDGVEE